MNTEINGPTSSNPAILEANRILYILEIGRFGSIRKAAEHLGLAPSVISRQVARLEEELRIKLFHRSSKGVKPTEAGYLLLEHATNIAESTSILHQHLAYLRGIHQSSVRVFCGEGFVTDFVANCLPQFTATHSQITIHLTIAGTPRIVDAVSHSDADIGIVYQPELTSRVRSVAISRQPLCAIVPRRHPLLSQRGPVTLADCLRHPHALLNDNFGIRQLVNRSAADWGVSPNPLLETSSFDALRYFVVRGLGITLLPQFSAGIELEQKSVSAISLADPLFNAASVHLIVRSNRRLPPSVSQLVSHIACTMSALSSPRCPASNTVYPI